METFLKAILITAVAVLIGYSIIGTDGKVDAIRQKAPLEMKERNWTIIRYEGFEYGSWGRHGGKVWYHVANIDNPNIQYRVFVTMWDGELQWHYGEPERLERFEVEFKGE
jgi:hypothetical protein